MADDIIDIIDVDESVPMHPGHTLIDLGNDQGGLFDRRLDDIHADPQAHKTMFIRRASRISATLI